MLRYLHPYAGQEPGTRQIAPSQRIERAKSRSPKTLLLSERLASLPKLRAMPVADALADLDRHRQRILDLLAKDDWSMIACRNGSRPETAGRARAREMLTRLQRRREALLHTSNQGEQHG